MSQTTTTTNQRRGGRHPERPIEVDLDGVAQRLGQRLRDLRLQRGLHLEDIARAGGISDFTCIRVEGGMGLPTLTTLCKVAAALDVPVAELLAEDDQPGPAAPSPATKRTLRGPSKRAAARGAS
jgi:transcriptional regulator with XRE-family HTH domain